ncbi:RagB/SusD family nutrient uptake outer membrane protein [Marinoscillum furvescens]|uniref:Putative outer membrane starch-binding protein n=1 Tax=Marinoscillum furvescens DSM 4134 TaxID=1122208 RepID=A0A3D9LHQ1_MARFU|nr:RagB/SusD family nutrient uptake outer membrane protein [Marinoscillum furvescens]REE05539.1 putative outer membrane starch-binding protein [Marinoscillum furvescens DSM 4134]
MKKLFSILIAAGLLLTSCKDEVLDQVPQGALAEGVEVDEQIMDNLITAAYSSLTARFINLHHVTFQGPTTNWIADVRSDDAYKGGGGIVDQVPIHQAETYVLNPTNDLAFNKWLNLTWAIARTNVAIGNLQVYENANYPTTTRMAEMRFLRAHFHFDLVRNFGNVPWLDEEVLGSEASNTEYTKQEILELIEADMQYAFENLPEEQEEIGRVNKYTAAAYMAKVLVEQQKWSEVPKYTDFVINSGKYALLDEFEDLASLDFENSEEIVFTVQFAKTENLDLGHNIGNILNVTFSNAYPGGDDFYLASQNLVNAFKTDAAGLPVFEGFDNAPHATGASYNGPVDPRVDFSVGRNNIPWKQSGVYTFAEWGRSNDYPYNYSSKKHLIDANDPRLHDGLPWAASGLNYAIIRYAEVLLWKAEALIEGNIDLEEARNLINEVRARAKNSTYVRTLDGVSEAANYQIDLYPATGWTQDYARQALRRERRLELAMEGHRMFDLNRWGITAQTINEYLKDEFEVTPYLEGVTFEGGTHEYYPIPQAEIDKNPGLYKQNSGY